MIELRNLTKAFDRAGKEIIVLDDISVTFAAGKISLIMGPSGVGKSTLLTLIAGTQAPTSGAVFFNSKNITQFSEQEHAELLHSSMGLVFQYPYLIPEFSVLENITLKGAIGGMNSADATKRAEELLEQIGLVEYAHQAPQALSGGEQQRVALARALFLCPKFLLADEPTAHLDSGSKTIIIQLIQKFQKEYGMGLLVCSHDPVLMESADHAYLLEQGQLIQQR